MACGAGALAGRSGGSAALPYFLLVGFAGIVTVAGVVVASETGPALARYLGLGAVAIGATMLTGGAMLSLRAIAAAQDERP